MKTTTRPLLREDRGDNGFTLVEILVVIIIIGILAAIAIPIFLNQQRTARDSATASDVRNLAAAVETALVSEPEAKYFILTGAVPGNTTATLQVGTSGAPADMSTPITISKTEGTQLRLNSVNASTGEILRSADDDDLKQAGSYIIRGHNADGQEYDSEENALVYKSAEGGLQR